MTAWPGVKNWTSETLTSTDLDTYLSNGLLHLYEKIPTGISPADRAGVAGAGMSEEYDTGTTGLTWNDTPTTVDSNTTIAGHLYVATQANTTVRLGTKSWAPAGAFDARMSCMIGCSTSVAAVSGTFGLHIGNSDNSSRIMANIYYTYNSGVTLAQGHTYTTAGGYVQRGASATVPSSFHVYLRVVRDGSNNCSFYWSMNGSLWNFIATQSFTFTVANIGFMALANATAGFQAAVDWLRTDV